ncbi:MAG: glutamate-5-semialdehyde dehydrogenase [Clostridiales Family XIII bacterium]|jgi:glutamate-5-semialdehyde dehydrogenase|nr:glutamate-5-semialdehyde dehydrogenase [Clostridiales Family XIII bacterium]
MTENGVYEIAPLRAQARKVKNDSYVLSTVSIDKRNEILKGIAEALMDKADEILAANARDLKDGEAAGLPSPIMKRLVFDEKKLDGVVLGLRDLYKLPDPIGKVLLERELDEDLLLKQVTCPIGVIGVIFESRPDALVQIASLCLKSGNCAILKGGSEAKHTNRILAEIIHDTGVKHGLPDGFLTLLELRSEIDELLKCSGSIDLIIPRGSNDFVRYIMDNSDIPVMGHSDGICHVYVDKAADLEEAVKIAVDSKTQYVAACNTAETLLVHEDVAGAFLPNLQKALLQKDVVIHATEDVRAIVGEAYGNLCEGVAGEANFKTEYSDYVINIKIVRDLEEAVQHINTYGSHHTDAIITEDGKAAEDFMNGVDSAGVYQNASTRFADGFRYGFGAEVGISTGKLHARGPVGLEGLVTYKYKLYGHGNVVDDYAEGRKSFKFKNIL